MGIGIYATRHEDLRPDFTDIEWLIPVEEYAPSGLYKYSNVYTARYLLKVLMEIGISSILLICLSPLFLLIAIIIKITSKGPVFFKQERIGKGGKKFSILKFRTMDMDAELKKTTLLHLNEAGGPAFKIQDDPRITKFGRILRKTGLDELPQFFNVVKREMSLIGPRPPLESEVRQYEKWQLRRLTVKPGITCIWQIQPERHKISFDEWVTMDLDYIDNWSLKRDTELFFGTIKTVFLAGGH